MSIDAPRASQRDLIPWGLIGALVLVVAVERSLDRSAHDFVRGENWDWKTSRQAASKATRYDVLCLGSSVTQQAIVPKVIEQRSGWRAYNLSVCWGQVPGHYFLLKRAIRRGAKLKAVVVEMHPQCLAGSYWGSIRLWPELIGPVDTLDLAWTARDPDFFASTVLAHTMPSIRYRFAIRERVRSALRGTVTDLHMSSLVYLRNKKRNQGALISPKRPDYKGDVAPQFAGLAAGRWGCDPVNEVYVRKLLALARSRGITVYWLLTPYTPELQARREKEGLDARYSEFARGFLAEFPNLVVLDARHSAYQPTVFTDAAHLDRDGACTLSTEVGKVLRADARKEPGRERWVNLPRFQMFPATVPVEDLKESSVAIHSLLTRNRR